MPTSPEPITPPPDLVSHGTVAYNDSIACNWTLSMSTLTIRNLDDETKTLLRTQAARHGCSMEQEVREILRRAVQPPLAGGDFARRIQQRFAGLEAEDLAIPERRPARLTKAGDS
jgi:plasmid stability protein